MARNILAEAISETTRASYASAVNHVAKFHEKQGSTLSFPISSDTLCLWMADSIDKLSYSSIRHYLHGIATTQQELGHPNPLSQNPLLWRMFKAIKRLQGKQVVRQRLPITVKILTQIDSLFDTTKEVDLCMRAAMWLGTCGLLRSGELERKSTTRTTLKLQHLTFHAKDNSTVDPLNTRGEQPRYMTLRLEQSKTDRSDVVLTSSSATHKPFNTCLLTYAIATAHWQGNHCSSATTDRHSRHRHWSRSPKL